MMSYSSINTEKAVASSRKKKTAVTEDEPLPFEGDYTEDGISEYKGNEIY